MRVVRNQFFEPVLLAGCSGCQTDTQQQCLLYNQYEYGRYQEGGKPVGGVEDGYVLILDGVGCYFILAGGSIAGTFHFNIRIHGERHVGVGSEQCLVIEQSAHVAEDADLRLLAPDYVIAEAGGYVDDAVCLALFQHESGFFHIGAMRHDACFGTGIHFPQIFPAQGTARVVHHHGRYFTDCFVGIDERIYQRICQRNEYKEYQHTLVAKEVA